MPANGQTSVNGNFLVARVSRPRDLPSTPVWQAAYRPEHCFFNPGDAQTSPRRSRRRLLGAPSGQLSAGRPPILDDFGLKPLTPDSPEDLYDVINERYEKRSVILTSNRAPAEWPVLFCDSPLASAGLDLLAHRAEVVVIRGDKIPREGPLQNAKWTC